MYIFLSKDSLLKLTRSNKHLHEMQLKEKTNIKLTPMVQTNP